MSFCTVNIEMLMDISTYIHPLVTQAELMRTVEAIHFLGGHVNSSISGSVMILASL